MVKTFPSYLIVIFIFLSSLLYSKGWEDSVITISMDKKVYQMGEKIKILGEINNLSKQNLIMGFPIYFNHIKILRKLHSYGPSLLSDGEPQVGMKLDVNYVDSLFIDKGSKLPPNFRDTSTLFLVPSVEYHYGLNPGTYSLQLFVRGGPPPRGGWWSNLIEFEVSEPQGEEAESWKLLSLILKRIEPLKTKERELPLNAYKKREAYSDSIDRIREEGYTKVLKSYSHSLCAQYVVSHLKVIYDRKINAYISWGQFDSAREMAGKVVPDSLSKSYQVFINEKEKESNQRKEEFRQKMLKQQEENLKIKLKKK